MKALLRMQLLLYWQKVSLNENITESGLHNPLPPQKKTHHILKGKRNTLLILSVSWDTERLESTLRNWPTETPINWSAVAREHYREGMQDKWQKNSQQNVKSTYLTNQRQDIGQLHAPKKRNCLEVASPSQPINW